MKIKSITSLLITLSLLIISVPVNAATYPQTLPSSGYYNQQSYYNQQTNDSGNTINSGNTSNSNNTIINSNNIVNSNNTTNNYYQPTVNTAITNNSYLQNGLSSDPAKNLDSMLDNNLKIGGISILDSFTTVVNNYQQYYKPQNNPQLKFFNGGSGDYGDFLLTIELSNKGNISRISYLQWNLINPIVKMNLGSLKAGDSIDLIAFQYGKPDEVVVRDEVKQVIYNNLSYKIYPITLRIYVNNYTNQVYGYEVALKG